MSASLYDGCFLFQSKRLDGDTHVVVACLGPVQYVFVVVVGRDIDADVSLVDFACAAGWND